MRGRYDTSVREGTASPDSSSLSASNLWRYSVFSRQKSRYPWAAYAGLPVALVTNLFSSESSLPTKIASGFVCPDTFCAKKKKKIITLHKKQNRESASHPAKTSANGGYFLRGSRPAL